MTNVSHGLFDKTWLNDDVLLIYGKSILYAKGRVIYSFHFAMSEVSFF